MSELLLTLALRGCLGTRANILYEMYEHGKDVGRKMKYSSTSISTNKRVKIARL